MQKLPKRHHKNVSFPNWPIKFKSIFMTIPMFSGNEINLKIYREKQRAKKAKDKMKLSNKKWAKDKTRQVTQEETQMASKQLGRCRAHCSSWKGKLKPQWDAVLLSSCWQKLKGQLTPSIGKAVEQQVLLYTAGGV